LISESLQSATYFDSPFPHVVSDEALDPSKTGHLLDWLEQAAPWKLVEETFYEQYEFSLSKLDLPLAAAALVSRASIQNLSAFVERSFGTRLTARVDITAHKLQEGQRIRIHNDFIPGQESHRVLIQLNRGWADENGGLLMLFDSPDSSDLRRVFRPVHNSCVAFEISQRSHHAVSMIHGGQRFTLVYSFFAAS
jgi:Rps23 Pro-64 3,4-dihydroxylase Tpa1-like proline 4-hydroxylase